MVMVISLFLGQNSPICVVQGIGFHSELLFGIGMHENGSLTDSQLEKFESVLLVLGPLPGLILLEKVMQRSGDVGEAQNPSVIKVYKTDELTHPLNGGGVFPITHIGNLLVFHFESIATNVDTKKLHLFLMKFTFLQVAIKSGVFEALKYRQYSFYMFGFGLVMHKNIVQVDLDTLVQKWREHLVHISLKAGRSVGKTESHDLHSIRSEWCHERSFPLVTRPDLDLIVARLQIKLGEEFRSVKSIHHFVDTRQWVTILNRDLIQFPIVDNQPSGSIFLPHKEHQCGNWAFRISWFHYSCIYSIVEELMTLGMLLLVHLVRAAWLRKWL